MLAMQSENNVLSIAAWNCRGVKGAKPYLESLMAKADIIALSEHKLYEPELGLLGEINTEFRAFGKSSADLTQSKYGFVPGHCGIAILWRNNLSSMIKPLPELGTDRICVVKVYVGLKRVTSLYVVAVYMPHSRCTISDYQTHLDALESVIEVCSQDGELLIIGDWNAHFGSAYGPRGWGRNSVNANKTVPVMSQRGLTILDLRENVQGPEYTFCGENGAISYIDHCIVSKSLIPKCMACKVLDNEELNTSDHLALYVEVSAKQQLVQKGAGRRRTVWTKVRKLGMDATYTNPLDCMLEQYKRNDYPTPKPSAWSNGEIDRVFDSIVSAIQWTDGRLPGASSNAHQKPYWNSSLQELVRRKKAAWQAWVLSGRPRDSDNPVWLEHKKAKREFRRELRKQQAAKDLDFLREIDRAEGIDHRFFWSLVNRKRKTKPDGFRPFQCKDGTVLTDTADIRQAWGEYYSDLYTPKNYGYSEDFKAHVESELHNVDLRPRDDDSVLLQTPITSGEVNSTCQKLKNNKAAGPDDVQAEHLKHGGSCLMSILADLFNAMVAREYRPAPLKRGLIIPIPKGKKDNSIPDNNRGITLTSVIGKVYDSILVNRAEEWFTNATDDLQGCNRKQCSSVHTHLLLREAVSHARQRNRTVYVCLLDVKKAFDHVWIDGLFYKLRAKGMDPKLWRILKDAYTDFRCAVLVSGDTSQWFTPGQGIHQGDVWSMKMYCVYNDDLLRELRISRYGLRLGDIDCVCPTFADDIALLALSKEA